MTSPEADGARLLERGAVYDLPKIKARYSSPATCGALETHLLLHGVSCGACASAIERCLSALPGVIEAEVNFSTHRARLLWDESRISLGDIVAAVGDIGYGAEPYDPDLLEVALDRERRKGLRRIAVAAALGMQVMMLTAALYAGAASGMAAEFERLFRWLSLILTTGVMLHPAAPFFWGAVRSLRNRHLGLDVPVCLGLSIAYLASAVNTIAGEGEIYFESVVMFVLVLLVARFVQFEARRKSAFTRESLSSSLPVSAHRVLDDGGSLQQVPAEVLEVGDHIRVLPGETVPVDGTVVSGHGWVSEALLSGESTLLPRGPGDRVLAGAVNQRGPLTVVADSNVESSYVSRLVALARSASLSKPRLAQLTDRVATWFIAGVLSLAGLVALFWLHTEPQRWLPITISVLVVTCPCALSLATPTAITAAMGALAKCGLIVTSAEAVENLSRADCYLFDKTGTLTEGDFRLVSVEPYAPDEPSGGETCLRIAAALEEHSEHPIARALTRALADCAPACATQIEVFPGQGISGEVGGTRYWLGNARFISEQASSPLQPEDAPAVTTVYLASAAHVMCRFGLSDSIRENAVSLLGYLRRAGKLVQIVSGDHESVVASVAAALDVEQWRGNCHPEDKAAYIRAMEAQGSTVVMVCDGLNDSLASAGAAVSVVMGAGTDATLANADVILASSNLGDLERALRFVPAVRRVIIQNLGWALTYNVIALPSAAMGLIAPWMAALGMSLSSLLVVANSARLIRGRPAR